MANKNVFRQFISILFLNNLIYIRNSAKQTNSLYEIQIILYLVQVSYMFQPYMVIIRLLALNKENKFTVACWSEI